MTHPQRQEEQQLLIDPSEALSRFDAAAASLQITYAPTSPILFTDNDFAFQFRVCPQFLRKPQLPPAESVSDPAQTDISQPRALRIAFVPPAHNLTFNAYPVLRPSYLLLTASSIHRQTSPLTIDDFAAGRRALNRLSDEPSLTDQETNNIYEGDYMLIYNSGRASGCSRFHKHMQLFPRPPRSSFALFPDRPPDAPVNVPYVHELIHHRSSRSRSQPDETQIINKIHIAYTSALIRFRALLGIEGNVPVAHNVVMTGEWTVVIPRRTDRVNGLSANAAGMMGMVWVGTDAELNAWKSNGLWETLAKLGVAAEEDEPKEEVEKGQHPKTGLNTLAQQPH